MQNKTATTAENPSMNLVAMESTQFYPGNNQVLMLVAGLSCIIGAGIVKLVQCGQQNQDDGNTENSTVHGYEIARRAMIGLNFAKSGLSLIWKAYQLLICAFCIILYFLMLPIIVVDFINDFHKRNRNSEK